MIFRFHSRHPSKSVQEGVSVLPSGASGRAGARFRCWGGKVLVVAILGFVLCPVIVVGIAAFNASPILAFPPKDLSWRWFVKVIEYKEFQNGFLNAFIVTFFSSILSLLSGASLAFVLDRYRFRGKRFLELFLLSPLVIPHFTIGLGLLILSGQIGIERGYGLVILAHVILTLPFVLRSVFVSLQNLDRRLELAAAGLGATPLRILFTITIPLTAPGLIAGWLCAAILSFNEFTATVFITKHHTQTLPVAMYNYVREFADPSMAALSVMYIAVIAILLTLANSFFGLGKVLNVDRR
jgi:putative spermidine/putrescine transport system permease protein